MAKEAEEANLLPSNTLEASIPATTTSTTTPVKASPSSQPPPPQTSLLVCLP